MFVVLFLVQFCIILVRNGMFYEKIQIIIFGYHFLLSNRYRVYLLMKKLTHFGDALCKKKFNFYRTWCAT